MNKKEINIECVICGKITPYYLPSERFGIETPYCRIHRYDTLVYLYKNTLRHFASCDLYSYELIGKPYREKYIDPIIKELGKSIDEFNSDIKEENYILMQQMINDMDKDK